MDIPKRRSHGSAHLAAARRARRDKAKRKVCDLGHGAIIELTKRGQGGRGRSTIREQPHADWFYDLRRGRLCVYGGVLRFIDRAVDDGQPIEFTRQIAVWLEWYIADQYASTTDRIADGAR